MLIEVLRSGRSPRAIGVEAGHRMAQELPETADPIDRLEINAARQGFEPRRVVTRSSIDLILDRCPFQTAAATAPDVVCELHRGFAEGIAESVGATISVVDLIARDPRRGGCRLKLKRTTSPPNT